MTLIASTSLLAACGQAANSNENGQSQAAVKNSTDSQSEIIKYSTTYIGRNTLNRLSFIYLRIIMLRISIMCYIFYMVQLR